MTEGQPRILPIEKLQDRRDRMASRLELIRSLPEKLSSKEGVGSIEDDLRLGKRQARAHLSIKRWEDRLAGLDQEIELFPPRAMHHARVYLERLTKTGEMLTSLRAYVEQGNLRPATLAQREAEFAAMQEQRNTDPIIKAGLKLIEEQEKQKQKEALINEVGIVSVELVEGKKNKRGGEVYNVTFEEGDIVQVTGLVGRVVKSLSVASSRRPRRSDDLKKDVFRDEGGSQVINSYFDRIDQKFADRQIYVDKVPVKTPGRKGIKFAYFLAKRKTEGKAGAGSEGERATEKTTVPECRLSAGEEAVFGHMVNTRAGVEIYSLGQDRTKLNDRNRLLVFTVDEETAKICGQLINSETTVPADQIHEIRGKIAAYFREFCECTPAGLAFYESQSAEIQKVLDGIHKTYSPKMGNDQLSAFFSEEPSQQRTMDDLSDGSFRVAGEYVKKIGSYWIASGWMPIETKSQKVDGKESGLSDTTAGEPISSGESETTAEIKKKELRIQLEEFDPQVVQRIMGILRDLKNRYDLSLAPGRRYSSPQVAVFIQIENQLLKDLIRTDVITGYPSAETKHHVDIDLPDLLVAKYFIRHGRHMKRALRPMMRAIAEEQIALLLIEGKKAATMVEAVKAGRGEKDGKSFKKISSVDLHGVSPVAQDVQN